MLGGAQQVDLLRAPKVLGDLASVLHRPAGMFGQFERERIAWVRRERGVLIAAGWRFGCAAAAEVLDRRKGQRVDPRAVAGKLKLVRGVAEDRVAEQVLGFGVHARIVGALS